MQAMKVGGKTKVVERPLALNFLFVRCELADIKVWINRHPEFRLHLVYEAQHLDGTQAQPLVVSEYEMDMFRRTVEAYKDGQLPVIAPADQKLVEGDVVRIMGGAFNGVEGVLVAQQGKKGGCVQVSISYLCTVTTMHIEPECLQILSFSKNNKHLYQQLDSYAQQIDLVLTGQADRQSLELCTRRYSEVKMDSVNTEAKMASLLRKSYAILGMTEKESLLRSRLATIKAQIKSAATLAFVERYADDTDLQKD
ncbi:MAG: hypothetical protein HUK02_05840 [Bacteroidaceae bacterium]|nr:hypothetical protein [Bacteroidaceae bacterium]